MKTFSENELNCIWDDWIHGAPIKFEIIDETTARTEYDGVELDKFKTLDFWLAGNRHEKMKKVIPRTLMVLRLLGEMQFSERKLKETKHAVELIEALKVFVRALT